MSNFVNDFFAEADVNMQVLKFEIEDMIKGIDTSGDALIQKSELKIFIRKAMGIKGAEVIAEFESSSSSGSYEESSSDQKGNL